MNRRTMLAFTLVGIGVLGASRFERAAAQGGAAPRLGAADGDAAMLTAWPAVAYNADRSEFLVVFGTVTIGPLVVDVRARRFRHDGVPIGGSFVIAAGPADAWPRIAYDVHASRYLVVWTRVTGSTGAVLGRLLDSSGTPLTGEIALSDPDVSAVLPDVAARSFHLNGDWMTRFVVVWRQTSAFPGFVLQRVRLTGDGAVLGGDGQLSHHATPEQDRNPRIDYDPFADRFLAVWSEDGVVRGRTIAPSGNHSPEFTVSSSVGKRPALAFDPASRRHLVVWEGHSPDGTQSDLTGQFLSSDATPAAIGGHFLVHPTEAAEFRPEFPEVTAETGTFVVVYEDRATGEARYRRVTGTGIITTNALLDASVLWPPNAAVSAHGDLFATLTHIDASGTRAPLRVVNGGRWSAHYVHGPTGDYDGDGRADLFVFRPSTGEWHVRSQSTTAAFVVGAAGDTPVLLDWDGDGFVDLGTFRPSSGGWRILRTATRTMSTLVLGAGGDIPVPGDYLGDAKTEIAVFRPTTATWTILENGAPTATSVVFGEVGDVPVPADYDGDGKTDLGVWRASTGTWLTAAANGTPLSQVVFGQPGDTPLQGNFVGSPHADQVVFRPQERRWYRRDGAKGTVTSVLQNAPGQPMPLDYDGDGRLDAALFDWKLGVWSIRQGAADAVVAFGTLADIPAGSR